MSEAHRYRGIVIGAVLVSVSAVGGAIGLATGELTLGHELDQRLPFASPVFGGVALGLVVAVPFFLLALAAMNGDARTGILSILVGVSLIAWLAVELAFIRELSFFHPLFGVVGVLFVLAGRGAMAQRQAVRSGSVSPAPAARIRH
ncbi:MAG: hypothetical protein U0Q22_06435 [Acidimicrobiales bacterium]